MPGIIAGYQFLCYNPDYKIYKPLLGRTYLHSNLQEIDHNSTWKVRQNADNALPSTLNGHAGKWRRQ